MKLHSGGQCLHREVDSWVKVRGDTDVEMNLQAVVVGEQSIHQFVKREGEPVDGSAAEATRVSIEPAADLSQDLADAMVLVYRQQQPTPTHRHVVMHQDETDSDGHPEYDDLGVLRNHVSEQCDAEPCIRAFDL